MAKLIVERVQCSKIKVLHRTLDRTPYIYKSRRPLHAYSDDIYMLTWVPIVIM